MEELVRGRGTSVKNRRVVAETASSQARLENASFRLIPVLLPEQRGLKLLRNKEENLILFLTRKIERMRTSIVGMTDKIIELTLIPNQI